MARINTNVSSMIAQSNLGRNNTELNTRLQRLATGLRINRGADDPAGLIASERLRSELRGINQGVKNSERASSVIATAEGALSEVSDLLNSIKALTVEAGNTGALSRDEIAANQLQLDSAIDSITRIANTSSFAGLKLLNGSLAYNLSGVDTADIAKIRVNGAQLADAANIDVDVEVIGSAQTANLYMRADWAVVPGGAGFVNGILPSDTTLEVTGPDGVVEITFQSGTTIDSMLGAINARTSITGVAAARVSGAQVSSGLRLYSTAYGSDAFVSVRKVAGGSNVSIGKINSNGPPPAVWSGGSANVAVADRDSGKDVVALVNGSVSIGRGLEVAVRGAELDLSMILTPTFATTVNPANASTFNITGGGAKFQLGPQVTALQQTNIGVDSISASRLGGSIVTSGGSPVLQFLSSLKSGGTNELATGNLGNASIILETAIDEVSQLRGRLGAFERNVLQTNSRSLQTGLENISASESVIRDADFAKETSELTRAQILQSASTSVLAAANTSAQSVLQLLG